MTSVTKCFICNSTTSNPFSARYPQIACENCFSRTVDSTGNKVEFQNEDLSGGFVSIHYDSDGNVSHRGKEHHCFIDNVACYAGEHRFGGIVIKPL